MCLLAMKLALLVVVAVTILKFRPNSKFVTRRGSTSELKTRQPALAVILQMLMYTGRPLLGAMRYVLSFYPAFLVWSLRRFTESNSVCSPASLGILNLAWLWAFLSWSLVL